MTNTIRNTFGALARRCNTAGRLWATDPVPVGTRRGSFCSGNSVLGFPSTRGRIVPTSPRVLTVTVVALSWLPYSAERLSFGCSALSSEIALDIHLHVAFRCCAEPVCVSCRLGFALLQRLRRFGSGGVGWLGRFESVCGFAGLAHGGLRLAGSGSGYLGYGRWFAGVGRNVLLDSAEYFAG